MSPAQQVISRTKTRWLVNVGLFVGCLLVLLRTMVPTLYTLDSAEFAIGAKTLGIVHAPGYPLYLILAHLFTYLPLGDVAYRVNLFSAVCLAATAPVLFSTIQRLVGDYLIAFATTLIFMWAYYVWAAGIVAEIYAPQILTLTICAYAVATLYQGERTTRRAIFTGLLYGLAVAAAPTSILLAPALIAAFRLLHISWRTSILAAVAGLLLFCLTLVYFPVRYAAQPALNIAGQYDAAGSFQTVNLHSVQGIWWVLSGKQFNSLFFENGVLPAPAELVKTLSWFWGNYLGIGILIGLVGAYSLYRSNRGLLVVWLAAFLPYTYFFITYGAEDRNTMFGPSYLLWAILIAFGLHKLWPMLPARVATAGLVVLPFVFLVVNFSLLDESRYTTTRDYATLLMRSLPPNAVVFGQWWDIVPLQYLEIIEDQRTDVELYNVFLFKTPNDIKQYVAAHLGSTADTTPRPIYFIGAAQGLVSPQDYVTTPLLTPDTRLYTGAAQIVQRASAG